MKRAVLTYFSALCSVALTALATNACQDSSDGSNVPTTPAGSSGNDSGADTGSTIGNPSGTDSGADTSTAAKDAASDSADAAVADSSTPDSADAAIPNFCATQAGLALCADFDTPGALSADAGAATAQWDTVVGSSAEISVSAAKAQSQPGALLAALAASDDQSAKVVKTFKPAGGVSQAVYEFDVYIDALPDPGAGGFITDFQFSDALGNGGSAQDTFGFRISAFSSATGGTLDHANFEHNQDALPGQPGGDTNNPFPITGGAWNHVKIAVAFGASAATDAGAAVSVQAYINRSATAAFDKTYDAPFVKAPFARVADGVVYAFSKQAKWGVYYDNVTLKLQ